MISISTIYVPGRATSWYQGLNKTSSGEFIDTKNQIKIISLIFCFLVIFNFSQLLDAKKYKKCVVKTVEGIHFKFCVSKTKIKKDESVELKLTVKIPKNRGIYVAKKNIRFCGYSYSMGTLFFCLGDSNVFGDRIPKLYDLNEISKRGHYRDKISVNLSEIEKKSDVYLNGEIKLKFTVSFCKKICNSLKDIILKKEWSHWANQDDEWYIKCYDEFFRNFILEETIGIINVRIKE